MPRVTTPKSFWARVARQPRSSNRCWPWRGRLLASGYGQVGFEGRSQRAHRVAWQLARGPIPDGKVVCHHCDNPACCNPAHLFLGTQGDNNRDRHSKGRTRGFPGTRSRAKLTTDQLAKARELRGRGLSTQAIADVFGVSRGHVSKIVKGVLPKDARRERSVI